MELRRPAAYGYQQQCPHNRGVRQGVPPARLPAQTQAAPVRRASAAAMAQQQPATEPVPAPAPPAPPPPPPVPLQPTRAWLSAYAKDFTVAIDVGEHKAPLPLEPQRAEGGMAVTEGRTAAPEDGYYMLLWELGVGSAQGGATLQLGVNECASQLTYALHPGYDNGQQVTWLSKDDKVGLFLQNECEKNKAEVQCTSAQFTVIRLG